MKKYLLFFAFYPLLPCSAQLGGKAVDLREMSGKPIAVNVSTIKGSPFLNDQWGTGYVKFGNGRIVKDVLLRFNLSNNELNYKLNDIEFTFIDAATEFSFSYEEEGNNHQVLFRNGYPGAKPGTAQLFFEVMADGQRFQLLKRPFKSVVESYGYGSASEKSYKEGSEIYIYDVKSGLLSLVKNRQPLGESVPGLAKNIAALPGNEDGKFRSEKELMALFAKLNL